jgi:feruloyl esterase
MRILAATVGASLLSIPVHAQTPMTRTSCERLSSLKLPHTTITRAHVVEGGTLDLATEAAGASLPANATSVIGNLPSFCRVAARLTPSTDSDIKIEVWMPNAGWNGKFQAVGNGGWAGTISYAALASALRTGYATASTDTGHIGTTVDGSFAFGHPEKLVDFAYRAVHEMTVAAKAIIAAYFGNGPRLSYWNSCSTGGRQGLMEAQRYPDDFDGIIAGAPANYMTRLAISSLWVAHATLKDPASYIPPEKYPVIHTAVLDACDGRDGVKDGVLENPASCSFDPKVLQCGGSDALSCLTAPQVDAARKIYGPARNLRSGDELFPGLEPGSEMEWADVAGGPGPLAPSVGHFKYVVFKDPNWDFRTFDFDRDVTLTDSSEVGTLNAIDSNLKPFFGRGGKLLMYHGWNDQAIAPRNSINYFSSVVNTLGGEEQAVNSIRLFMVPGMNHCSGGNGTSVFDRVAVLDQWVEHNTPPQQIPASHVTDGKIDRTRPLCPYPQVARYKGTGSTNEAANFACSAN